MPYGPFGNLFPYADQHALNLDWIIQVAKDFLDQYTHIQDVNSDGETSLDQHTADGLAALAAEKDRLEGLLDAWYTTHSEDIAGQLTAAVASFQASAEEIGATVLASIPADYTALDTLVDDTRARLMSVYGGTVNLFDLSLLVGTTGITVDTETSEFYGKASAMSFELTPEGLGFLDGFPAGQRFTVSAEGYNSNATGTGLGIRCRVYYTDGTDDYLFAWDRNTASYTSKSVMTAANKTVSKIRFNYSSGGNDVWYIKNLQIVAGPAQAYAAFEASAIDKVSRNNVIAEAQNRAYVFSNVDKAFANMFAGLNVIDTDDATTATRISSSTGEASENAGTWATDYIPIREGMKLVMNKYVDSESYGTAFYDINKVFISGYNSGASNLILYAPANAAFVRMTFLNADLETAVAIISDPQVDEAKKYAAIDSKTKWLALGDSIVFGVYSRFTDGDTTVTGTCPGWVRMLADALNYDLTVMASKGMGYTAAVTGQDPEGGDTRISLSTLLDRATALQGPFNLITLCFGINDYTNPSQSSVSSIQTGLNEAIEELSTAFPEAQLVVITPFNASRYGDVSTNFCYGYARSNDLAIKDIADAIQERCDYYGVRCINASRGCLMNSFNIETLTPDGVHPSPTAHQLLAKTLAHELLY